MTTTATPARTTPADRLPFRTLTVSAAARQGLAPRRMTAEALHAWLPADGTLAVVWERIGYAGKAEPEYGLFYFRRYTCDTTGRTGVECVRADGGIVNRVPMGQGRSVRLLGRAA